MITRRRLLLTLSAFSLNLRAFALQFPHRRKPPVPNHIYPVYIGVDTTTGGGKGIYLSTFDSLTGRLSAPALAAETVQPSFFALSGAGSRRVLYAGNETSDASSSVTAFLLDPKSPGTLHPIGKVSSGFPGPCYVSVDSTGHAVFVADYAGSGIASFRILPNGALSDPVERIDFKDQAKFGKPGPNHDRQDAPHPHCATISADNRFLIVCDLGNDQISTFSIDPTTARLSTSEPHLFSNNRPGSGPRHVAFHPNSRWIYVINELDSTIDHYLWTTTHSQQSPQALLVVAGPPVKTISDSFPAAKNTAAEIAVSSNGYYVYASNRGEDSLVVFSIDQNSGTLKTIQRISCGGRKPRHFTFDPTGNWLLCGNQDSGSITVFKRDAATGQLSGPTQTLPVDAPLYTLFA